MGMGQVSLEDALALVVLYAEQGEPCFEKGAVSWPGRLLPRRSREAPRNSVVPYGAQATGNLQEIVWEIDPHAAAVLGIYKAANAENYIPTYKTH